jgi:tetratricopeptide (TPR) repeat protein
MSLSTRSQSLGRFRVLITGICVGIVLLSAVAYEGVRSNGFVAGDDPGYVSENPHVLAGLSGPAVLWAFTATEQSNWHPLTWLSHMLDVQLFGVDPGRHHLISVILHAANALLLFLLLTRMTTDVWPSALVAGLFAVHPLHVESVAYIAERKDVLSTLFWLLTIWAWLRFLQTRTVRRYAAVITCYALGLMAKPMLVTLPFTLLLLDFWPMRRVSLPVRQMMAALPALVREKLPLFAMACVSSAVTVIAQQRGGAIQSLTDLGLVDRLATALVAYTSYLRNTVWPASLSVFYPRPEGGFGPGHVAGAALVLVGVTALAVRLARRAPYVAFGWFWYLGTLVPVIGLVQVGDQALADRYTYVPLVGIFIAVVWGIRDAARGSNWTLRALMLASGCILVVLLVRTRIQVTYWLSTLTLYEHALAVNPNDYVAHNNVAVALYAAGRKDEALAHYARAVELKPGYSDAQSNLGAVLAAKGRVAEAIQHYEWAIQVQPKNVKALNNLGLAFVSMGRIPEAIQKWQDAIRLQPDFADAHSNLGVALAQSGRMTEAMEHFEAALRSNPNHAMARANLEKIRSGVGNRP